MQDPQHPPQPPVRKRTFFALIAFALFAGGMFLSRVLLPHGTAHMDALEVELPLVVSLAGATADFFGQWWWAFGIGSALLGLLAWTGGLDRLLKPGIAAGLVGVLLLTGMCLSVWNTNDTLLRLLGETAAPR